VLDLTMQAIQSSLDGLAARQRVIAENLANAATPGYQARTVSFEDSLRAAVDRGRPASASISTAPTGAPSAINGNNVSVDQETLAMTETGLRYQLATDAMNNKFRLLGTAIGRG